MKNLKKWLLPALTLLVVLGAVLLPPWAAQVKDAQLLGRVHTEEMAGSLSFQAASLTDRLGLLARWSAGGEVASLTQELADDEIELHTQQPVAPGPAPSGGQTSDDMEDLVYMLLEARVRAALDRLAPEGTFLRDVLPQGLEGVTAQRLLLWEPSGGLAASFLQVQWEPAQTGRAWSLSLTLDEENDLILSLTLKNPHMAGLQAGWGVSGVELPYLVGEHYFSYLGVDSEVRIVSDGESAVYALPESGALYLVQITEDTLTICPDDGCGWGTFSGSSTDSG